jgi:hypothetical protein
MTGSDVSFLFSAVNKYRGDDSSANGTDNYYLPGLPHYQQGIHSYHAKQSASTPCKFIKSQASFYCECQGSVQCDTRDHSFLPKRQLPMVL